MAKAERVSRREQELPAVLAPIRDLGEELGPEEFFSNLEGFIDLARVQLQGIPDPGFRAELRELYRGIIENALSLRMGKLGKRRADPGRG